MTEASHDQGRLPANAPGVVHEVFDSVASTNNGSLRQYFNASAMHYSTVDGRHHAEPLGYTTGEELQMGLLNAVSEAAEGRIGVANLLRGSMHSIENGGSVDNPSIRGAFEALPTLFTQTKVVGGGDIHDIFRPFAASSERPSLGYIHKGVEPGSQEEVNVAKAAKQAVETGVPVALNNERGESDGKLMPIFDPNTGTLVPNVLLHVHGSGFRDQAGLYSFFTNMAFANLIVLPDRVTETQATS